MTKTTYYLFASIFLSSLLWLAIIPLWHTPDEQSHLAQTAFLAEMDRNPGGGELDATEEIFTSEKLLGTARDKVGNNKFTFHPHYNLEYTNSYYGKYEASISALSKTSAKKNLVKAEASYYPKLYYLPGALLYKLFYSSDLFTRVFVIRGWSLLLFISNVFVVYKLGELLFSDHKLKALVLTALVGFQPMMIFSNIGVNSDSLGNLLFTLFLYSSLRLILYGTKLRELFLLTIVSWLAINSKVQFIVILPVFSILLIFLCLRDIKGRPKWIILTILFSAAIILLTHPYGFTQLSSLTVVADSLKQINLSSYLKFTREYTFTHTLHEVMPWFWGVYKWLGVTYPISIYRIINRIVFLSLVGFTIWLMQVIFKHKWHKREVQCVIFLIFTSIVYFIAISIYDWLSWYRSSFQLGVQGRYFFPIISINMLVIILGLSTLLPKKWNMNQYGSKLIILLIMMLNMYALYFVSSSYYDVSSISRFITQASQYKPWFFKGNYLLILISVCITSFWLFFFQLIFPRENNTRYHSKNENI